MSSVRTPLEVFGLWPDGRAAMHGVDRALESGTLSLRLLELVRLRCSAVNGCDFCIAMHRKKAREAGLSAAEVVAIQSLGEEPIFCRDERRILDLCDAVTRLADAQALRGVVDALANTIGALQTVEVLYAIWRMSCHARCKGALQRAIRPKGSRLEGFARTSFASRTAASSPANPVQRNALRFTFTAHDLRLVIV